AAEDPMRDGVVLTLRELSRVCENNGLVEVAPAPGDAFDPERHNAMSVVQTAEVPAGTVFQVFQKGYVLHDQLLRPALVSVAGQEGAGIRGAALEAAPRQPQIASIGGLATAEQSPEGNPQGQRSSASTWERPTRAWRTWTAVRPRSSRTATVPAPRRRS